MCRPANRARIEAQSMILHGNPPLVGVLNAVPSYVLVLNRSRQIVFANSSLLRFIGVQDMKDILGRRIGDILDCVNAATSELGCGSSEACITCGTAKSITAFLQEGMTVEQESRIRRHGNGQALDFRVHTAPFPDDTHKELLLLFLTDIANEKRRRALERIFFHDVANLSTGLVGLSRVLCEKEMDDEKRGHIQNVLHRYTNRLAMEIDAQRILSAAECNELVLQPESCVSLNILGEVAAFYSDNAQFGLCQVQVAVDAASVTFVTDQRLLHRIIGNMTKNAAEASPKEGLVTLGCRDLKDGGVEFWVHNRGVIPREIQLQIFQRSFSTKGTGRGLGTHSIKLLGERYLGGQVSFSSSAEDGTTFRFHCPLTLSQGETNQ